MRPVLIAIPAFNEAATIGACVAAALEAARAAGLEPTLVVANDASTDATATLALEAGATVIDVEHRQIAAVRNSAATAVLALIPPSPDDMLVFVDGDTLMTSELLLGARHALDEGCVGGGARVRFDEAPRWARWFMATMAGPLLWWWGYAGGCFLYCRRDAFEAVGGFDEQYFAGEEIYFLGSLKKLRRGRVRILRHAAVTSGRKMRQFSALQLVGVLFTVARTRAKRRDGLELWYSGERERPTNHPR